MVTRFQLVLLFIGIYLSIIPSECIANSFYVTIPKEIPKDKKGRIELNVITIQEEQFEISVEIHNEFPLGVWISINTQNHLELISSDFSILSENEEEFKAITFLGPSTPWKSPRAFHQGCGPRRYSLGKAACRIDLTSEEKMLGNYDKGVFKSTSKPISFSEKECFMLWFNFKPAPPEDNFQLLLNGLILAGKKIDFPAIKFGTAKITQSLLKTKVEPMYN